MSADVKKIVEQGLLFDFYGDLLTDHQKRIYEDAVFQDLSLSEIAEQMGITRQGVHDLIKRCDRTLLEYESKLHLVEKFSRVRSTVQEINRITERLAENGLCGCTAGGEESGALLYGIERIKHLSNEILEEL